MKLVMLLIILILLSGCKIVKFQAYREGDTIKIEGTYRHYPVTYQRGKVMNGSQLREILGKLKEVE